MGPLKGTMKKATTTTTTVAKKKTAPKEDSSFASARSAVQRTLQGPLFTTHVADLWPLYLKSFPPRLRKEHDCHECRRFVQNFGGLVSLEGGKATSVFWDPDAVCAPYTAVFEALKKAVEAAPVSGVFLTSEKVIGTPVTGAWTHFHAKVPEISRKFSAALTAGQAMAEKKQDWLNVEGAVAEVELPELQKAEALLEGEMLYRGEVTKGPMKFLHDLVVMIGKFKGKRRNNLIWEAVATAPAGFCHPRSSVWWTLLEDLDSGMPTKDALAKFKEKMNPLQYRRPTAPPAEGTINQAEKLVAKLGLERSLGRRFLRKDELLSFWEPTKVRKSGGTFTHLRKDGAEGKDSLPDTKMTWVKFRDTVLPGADKIEILLGLTGHWYSFTTAEDAEAPPILKWDREDCRNPAAWYTYIGGAPSASFGKSPGYAPVYAMAEFPCHWNGSPSPENPESVLFAVEGAGDTESPGLALFPENLKAELHGIRSVVEAHSKSAKMLKVRDPVAGLAVRKGNNCAVTLRVHVGDMVRNITVDRWD